MQRELEASLQQSVLAKTLLEDELGSTRHKLDEIHAQLQLAEQVSTPETRRSRSPHAPGRVASSQRRSPRPRQYRCGYSGLRRLLHLQIHKIDSLPQVLVVFERPLFVPAAATYLCKKKNDKDSSSYTPI